MKKNVSLLDLINFLKNFAVGVKIGNNGDFQE